MCNFAAVIVIRYEDKDNDHGIFPHSFVQEWRGCCKHKSVLFVKQKNYPHPQHPQHWTSVSWVLWVRVEKMMVINKIPMVGILLMSLRMSAVSIINEKPFEKQPSRMACLKKLCGRVLYKSKKSCTFAAVVGLLLVAIAIRYASAWLARRKPFTHIKILKKMKYDAF
ncbi:MAG: hypothetical protein IJV38_00735 [Prevotella sp.]|nr:hypothetical protein [Prevotella sp.]